MRRNSAIAKAAQVPQVPRGWIILGAALISWMLVAVLMTSMSQLFSFVSAAV